LSARGNLKGAALIGLVSGFAAAGAYLLFCAARVIFFPVDCSTKGSLCALEQEVALHLARRQTLAGGALLLLALALFFRLRAKWRDESGS
jgi:uncharacterized membrane protein